ILSGRITDDRGDPVADATLELYLPSGRGSLKSRTDDEGRYRFDAIVDPGEYRLRVQSLRCVSISRYDELPRLNLTAETEMVRDIRLQRGCRIRIRTVDEQGKPVSGVSIYRKNVLDDRGNAESVSSNRQGEAIIGGLPASKSEYIFGTSHQKF